METVSLTRISHGSSSRSGVNARGCKAFTTEGTADVLSVLGGRGSVTQQARAVTPLQQKICEICGLEGRPQQGLVHAAVRVVAEDADPAAAGGGVLSG